MSRVTHVAVFGGKGGGEIVASVALRVADAGQPVGFLGYLNDTIPAGYKLVGGLVLGPFNAWMDLPEDVEFLAPLHKAGEMKARSTKVIELEIPAQRWATLIDPASVVAENAVIQSGVICAASYVGPSTRLGHHVALWPGAQIGHDGFVEDFVFIGRASVVSGYCSIRHGAFLGTGSIIKEHCSVGRFALVGAGSVVLNDVPDYAVVAGNPARVIGTTAT